MTTITRAIGISKRAVKQLRIENYDYITLVSMVDYYFFRLCFFFISEYEIVKQKCRESDTDSSSHNTGLYELIYCLSLFFVSLIYDLNKISVSRPKTTITPPADVQS